ncbi:MAG: cytochrome c biogenesis protein CcdA [Bacteroidota bacterium]
MRKSFLALFLFFICSQGFAQGMKKVHLSACTNIINETEAEIVLTARLDKGWHLYAFNAGGDGTLISPVITIAANKDVVVVGNPTEKGKLETKDDAGIGPYHFYENKIIYTQKVKYKKLSTLKITFDYQTCDEKGCLPPDYEDFTLDMNVSCNGASSIKDTTPIIDTSNTAATPIDSTLATISASATYGDWGTPVGDCGEAIQEELSIWTALLYGLLGGFAALFFPCTLPMIPMTISFFLKGSGDKKEGVKKGVLYGFSIFLVYFLFSLPFVFLGWGGNTLNELSTNVWVNLAFFIIFIVFAFSLFGYYDISMPSSIANKVDEKSNIGSMTGIFFMALTLAIVSFSCTGPILGLVLGNISNSKLIMPAMSGFGLGLGIPFALFAMFPNLLKALPKSGGWLTVLKVVFGFIELAFALKFLSNADLVKQWGFMKRELFIGLWILVCIMTALYLMGWFRFKKDPTFHSTIVMKVLAGICIVFAGYLSMDYFNKDISLVSGFPPPKFYSWFYKAEKHAKGSTARTHDVKGLKVYLYLEDAIAEGKKQGKPVMIDFTGWACVNCRKMEENVWSKPEIYKILQKDYIIASLYVDEQIELPKNEQFASPVLNDKFANTVGDKWMDLSLRDFKSATQPFYALIDPDNHRILNTPRGYTPDDKVYKSFLECGKYQYKELHKK